LNFETPSVDQHHPGASRHPFSAEESSQSSAIILDFDGVILESADVKTRAFGALFENLSGQIGDIKKYLRENGGLSRYEKFRYIYEQFLGREISEDEMNRLDSQFSELVKDEIRRCPFVPGVVRFLERHSGECPLFIVSATPEPELVSIVRDRGLTGFFKGIYGAPASKSSLLQSIAQKSRAVFIGDSLHDYRAAADAGVRFIGRVADERESPFAGLPVAVIQDFDHFPFERWLSEKDIAGTEYSGYWNDEREEEAKEWYVLDGDFDKMESHLSRTGLVPQLQACVQRLQSLTGNPLHGVGADLACGNFWSAPHLLSMGDIRLLYGVEYSHHRLMKLGPKVLEHYGVPRLKVVLCLGTFYDLRIPDGNLDFVLLAEAFHHADRPAELLAEVHRVLKPGGAAFVIGEPRLGGYGFLLRLLTHGRAFLQTGLVDPVLGDHQYTAAQYLRMFRTAGFTAHEVNAGKHPYAAYLLVKNT
jgi:phosphoglycolate phosphatase